LPLLKFQPSYIYTYGVFLLSDKARISSLKAVMPQEATGCLLLFQFLFSRGPHI